MSEAPSPQPPAASGEVSAAAAPQLELRGVTKRFGGVAAVDGVSFEVAKGEIVGIIGPNGAGKTTLLNCISGVHRLDGGDVRWQGASIAGMAPHRVAKLGIGRTFQIVRPFGSMTVRENAAIGALFGSAEGRRGVAGAFELADEVLELVGLAGFEHRSVDELSGGEQQRVALARALAPQPRLLMLDEPLGSLDRRLRERLLDELRDLFTRLHLSVLFVTHDHDEAFALAERVAVMHGRFRAKLALRRRGRYVLRARSAADARNLAGASPAVTITA